MGVRFDSDPVDSRSRPLSDREDRKIARFEEHCASCSACCAARYTCPKPAMCPRGHARWRDILELELVGCRDGQSIRKQDPRGSIEYVEVPAHYRNTRRLLQAVGQRGGSDRCENRRRICVEETRTVFASHHFHRSSFYADSSRSYRFSEWSHESHHAEYMTYARPSSVGRC